MNDSIDAFWKCFEQYLELLSLPQSADPSAMNELLEALRKIDPRLYYHIGQKGNGRDLVLSAEGHPDLYPVLAKLKDQAPVSEHWSVVVAFDGLMPFGKRNQEVFPDDENGNVLWDIAQDGDNFFKAREVDFSIVFPNRKAAHAFMTSPALHGLKSKVEREGLFRQRPWGVTVTRFMHLTHREITGFEKQMANLAEPLGGKLDGWGSFGQT